jgi:hypothetical protein
MAKIVRDDVVTTLTKTYYSAVWMTVAEKQSIETLFILLAKYEDALHEMQAMLKIAQETDDINWRIVAGILQD